MDAQEIMKILEKSCRASSQQDFLSVFTESINKQAGFSNSLCFKLDSMKERLILVSSTLSSSKNNVLTFSLDDNQNPIVYALTSNKSYLVKNPGILCSSVSELFSLMSPIPLNDTMLCYPFKYGESKVNYGVFVFFADDIKIKNMQKNTIYQRLFKVMVEILRVYALAETKGDETKAIKEDWAHLSRSNYQKTVREHIATQCIGSSKTIKEVWELIARAAGSDVAVLLRGETGVGKDLAASLIHQYSTKRSKKRFIVVNCAAIPENLLESELFGYRKGAFTGATHNKQGLIKQADGGTLFLDEIGDLSEILQAKLLRVLQEKSFIPVGSHEEEHSNFRLITATHRSLEERIEQGQFRQDLFYRINQFNITIPALTERKKDIPDLVDFFTSLYVQENATHISGYEKSAMKLLQEYHYPGNIRELKNIVFQACMFVGDNNLVTHKNIKTLLDSLMKFDLNKNIGKKGVEGDAIELALGETLPEAIDVFEQKIIRTALKSAGGSRLIAASSLGIPKRTLAYKCKKWEISNGH